MYKYLLSIYFVKIISFVLKLFSWGSGLTLPGYIVLKIYPSVFKYLETRIKSKLIFISGTNGKTTTSKMTADLLRMSGFKVLSNESGSNLLRGIVTSLLLGADLSGSLNYDYIVLEVDEFTVNQLVEHLKPDILALMNLSRDQLDRHWEIDLVADKWKESMRNLKKTSIVIVNSSQQYLNELSFANMATFSQDDPAEKLDWLAGDFNKKNYNCALVILRSLGVDINEYLQKEVSFTYAYGRGEVISYKGKKFRILLAKNPESQNQNLNYLLSENLEYDAILFVLNDNIPDGRDVSWIYDVDSHLIKIACHNKKIFCSGVRAYDMAIRVDYACDNMLDKDKLNNWCDDNLRHIVHNILEDPEIRNIVVLPNYSAMLEVRKITTGRKIL